METTTLATMIADVRSQTDTETPTPTNDHITDAELTRWLQQAYRELVDIIVDNGGEEALDHLAVSTTLTAPFTLPEDYYREVSVDASVDGLDRQLKRTAWRTRHKRGLWAPTIPQYRVTNGALTFFPSDQAPSAVTLWYVPALSAADLSAQFTTFNGWDEFVIACTAIKVCGKEETDPMKFQAARQQSMARVITACTNLRATTTSTIIAVATYAEDYID